MSDYRSKVISALSWSAGARAVSQGFSLVIGIILARLLTPDDFGLIAMVTVFTGLATLFADVGMGAALIQRKDIEERHFSTVFWANLFLGVVLMLLVFFASGPIANFYGRQELQLIGQVLSLTFVIGAFAMVQRQKLAKALKFRAIAAADVMGMLVGGAVGVALAFQGFGYWALVAQALILQATSMLAIWVGSSWMPKLTFNPQALRELLGFSFFVFATRTLQHISRSIDKLIAGRFMGGEAVGLLDKAQSMMLFPLQNVSHVVGSVMFPALSMVQSDTKRVRSVYLRSTQAISLLTFPMMAGMFVAAENFVIGVLGTHWSGLVPILQILCFAGLATSIVTITGAVYLSQGASKLQFKVNLITKPIAIIAVLVGMNWGLIGIAIGATTATWINSLISLSVAGKLIDLRLTTLARGLYKTLVAALIMAMITHWVSQLIDVHALVLLLIQITTGVIVYATLAMLFKLPALGEAASLLRTKIRQKS